MRLARQWSACAAALALAIPSPALSQQVAQEPAISPDQWQAINLASYNGQYRQLLDLLEQIDVSALTPQERSMIAQMRPIFDGFVMVDPARGRSPRAGDAEELVRMAAGEPRDAVAAIVERARETRVVIVNETHDNPRDRAFVRALAEALRPLGYTHYAAETLSSCCTPDEAAARMADLAARGYPVAGDGAYSNDPMFGFLLRRVVALGFQPVAYEWVPDLSQPIPQGIETVAVREAAQAENLAQAIAAAGPDARFLIHVGYSHAAEQPIAMSYGNQEWMAAQLKRLTGIDPLTIDQTGLSEFDRPYLHAGLAHLALGGAVILFNGEQPLAAGSNAALMDLQVLHPTITAIGGRPDWLARTGRRAVPVPAALMPQDGNALVQVFAADDGEDAVPIDQVVIPAGQEPPLLYVPIAGDIRWQSL